MGGVKDDFVNSKIEHDGKHFHECFFLSYRFPVDLTM